MSKINGKQLLDLINNFTNKIIPDHKYTDNDYIDLNNILTKFIIKNEVKEDKKDEKEDEEEEEEIIYCVTCEDELDPDDLIDAYEGQLGEYQCEHCFKEAEEADNIENCEKCKKNIHIENDEYEVDFDTGFYLCEECMPESNK